MVFTTNRSRRARKDVESKRGGDGEHSCHLTSADVKFYLSQDSFLDCMIRVPTPGVYMLIFKNLTASACPRFLEGRCGCDMHTFPRNPGYMIVSLTEVGFLVLNTQCKALFFVLRTVWTVWEPCRRINKHWLLSNNMSMLLFWLRL